jgi:hypothetical protein
VLNDISVSKTANNIPVVIDSCGYNGQASWACDVGEIPILPQETVWDVICKQQIRAYYYA